MQTIRRVPWRRIPLGCVVLEWPQIAGSSIPELSGYPVMTEGLRSYLGETYQFLRTRSVVIADPESGFAPHEVRDAMEEAAGLRDALQTGDALKKRLMSELPKQPDVREGISAQMRYANSAFVLAKSWARSVSQILRDRSPFGVGGWPGLADGSLRAASPAEIAADILTGAIASSRLTEMTLDIGVDVSRSMSIGDRSDFAFREAQEILRELSTVFRTLVWRLWLVSDGATSLSAGFRLSADYSPS